MTECESCKIKDLVISQLSDTLARMLPPIATIYPARPPSNTASTSFAERCACNPANGGTGICGCVLGGLQITS